ncbi:hypothetical protein E2C01_035914 [Portunus trituberculatus]|uniref:Uncharacterized protein n=1 Tax=Portunus trituberculatus TaxID=210409 RepID=A0A5B7F9N3_PORTR|nr:hypothetical protein [Portunus trituberculatus]
MFDHSSAACLSPKEVMQAGNGLAGGRGRKPASTTVTAAGGVAPCHLRCHRALVSTVQVRGSVDCQPCQMKMTVDMGAEKTFMRPELISACHLPEATHWLCRMMGHCTSL